MLTLRNLKNPSEVSSNNRANTRPSSKSGFVVLIMILSSLILPLDIPDSFDIYFRLIVKRNAPGKTQLAAVSIG